MGYAGKTLMLVEQEFPRDPRVFQEARTLAQNAYKVIVVALRGKNQKWRSIIEGISVYRIPKISLFKKSKGRTQNKEFLSLELFKGIFGYICEYFYFTIACFFLSLIIFLKEGFELIHAHNPPDTLFTVGFFYKLLGKKFIFDHHDLSPELFLSRFSSRKSIIYKGLVLAERLTCMVADRVIATNESYKEMEIKRDKVNLKDIFVVRNGTV